MYTLHVENKRTLTATNLLFNYIDNISLAPSAPNFGTNEINIPCFKGAAIKFALNAGSPQAGMDYWIWMSASGNYPGIPLNGFLIPLNWDVLFTFGLYNPNFPGSSGFLGQLDGFGEAAASITLPPDYSSAFVGFPLYFAYVVTSPGPSLPISFVSYPVHVKYVP